MIQLSKKEQYKLGEYLFAKTVKQIERILAEKANETNDPKDVSYWYRFYCRYESIINSEI